MTTIEIILFAVGAFLLVVGYRRSDRNKMLAAALLLFASAAIGMGREAGLSSLIAGAMR